MINALPVRMGAISLLVPTANRFLATPICTSVSFPAAFNNTPSVVLTVSKPGSLSTNIGALSAWTTSVGASGFTACVGAQYYYYINSIAHTAVTVNYVATAQQASALGAAGRLDVSTAFAWSWSRYCAWVYVPRPFTTTPVHVFTSVTIRARPTKPRRTVDKFGMVSWAEDVGAGRFRVCFSHNAGGAVGSLNTGRYTVNWIVLPSQPTAIGLNEFRIASSTLEYPNTKQAACQTLARSSFDTAQSRAAAIVVGGLRHTWPSPGSYITYPIGFWMEGPTSAQGVRWCNAHTRGFCRACDAPWRYSSRRGYQHTLSFIATTGLEDTDTSVDVPPNTECQDVTTADGVAMVRPTALSGPIRVMCRKYLNLMWTLVAHEVSGTLLAPALTDGSRAWPAGRWVLWPGMLRKRRPAQSGHVRGRVQGPDRRRVAGQHVSPAAPRPAKQSS